MSPGRKKAVRRPPQSERSEPVLKADVRVVRVKHGGEDPRTYQEFEVVTFPAGVPVAQVSVEANRSMEVAHNHWFSCRVSVTRNVVDSDRAVAEARDRTYQEVAEFVDTKLREAIEEAK